jgi:hypothetical protein
MYMLIEFEIITWLKSVLVKQSVSAYAGISENSSIQVAD